MVGIYKIESPSGRVYIGQSWNIEQRIKQYKQLKCKRQTAVYNSFVKYGVCNHNIEVVHMLPIDVTQEILNNYEFFYWESYKDVGILLMNVREPGSRGKHSEETKNKMKKSGLGKNTWTKGSVKSDEQKEHLSKINKGKVFSEDHKNNIKKAKQNISEETREKLRNAWKNRIVSEDTKQKISNSLLGNKNRLGNKHSEESKSKIKNSLKNHFNKET